MPTSSEQAAKSRENIVQEGCAPTGGLQAADPHLPTSGRYGAPPAVFAEAWARSRGWEYGLTQQEFFCVLASVGAKYLPAEASESEQVQFYGGLRHEELALARACAAGHESAWSEFLTRYRAKLYEAALSICANDAAARELADSLYAELYGTRTREGERISKLASYGGRGSLEGWLRTVLAQEYVNRYRSQKRTVSLEAEAEAGAQFVAPVESPNPEVDARLDASVDEALAKVGAEERYVLAAYFLDGRTLAEIARTIGVHESTVSRKLDRTVHNLRKDILRRLQAKGMDKRQAEEALETDVRDIRVNIRARLAQETRGPTFNK